MFGLSWEQILVELWPSLAEVQSSLQEDAYRGRLTEFYDSVDSLLHTLCSAHLPVQAYTDSRLEKGEPVARAFPPEIVQLAAYLGSSGIALAVYKALKLWVDLKNGRRIKIVDGGLEVEATQLTQEQFLELLEALRQRRDALTDTVELKEMLLQKGFSVVPVDSRERLEERGVLTKAAQSRANASDE